MINRIECFLGFHLWTRGHLYGLWKWPWRECERCYRFEVKHLGAYRRDFEREEILKERRKN